MTAYVTDAKGRRWSLPAPLAWRMEYTAGVPCDSFWMRCPWEKNSPTKPEGWVEFAADHAGERVFTGLVDECEVSVTVKGRILELSGRGMAARLLDNEALGQDYQSATQADIIRDHVAPYGVEVAPGAVLPPVSHLSVATGSSEWSVVYEFARYYGGVAPRFDREGRLVLSGWDDSRERVIDDRTGVLGMTRREIFFKVTLLQMIKRIVPPMSNEVITLVKDTSLARIISLQEVIWAGYSFLKGSHGYAGLLWPIFFTGVYYLLFNGFLTLLFSWVEKKLSYFR